MVKVSLSNPVDPRTVDYSADEVMQTIDMDNLDNSFKPLTKGERSYFVVEDAPVDLTFNVKCLVGDFRAENVYSGNISDVDVKPGYSVEAFRVLNGSLVSLITNAVRTVFSFMDKSGKRPSLIATKVETTTDSNEAFLFPFTERIDFHTNLDSIADWIGIPREAEIWTTVGSAGHNIWCVVKLTKADSSSVYMFCGIRNAVQIRLNQTFAQASNITLSKQLISFSDIELVLDFDAQQSIIEAKDEGFTPELVGFAVPIDAAIELGPRDVEVSVTGPRLSASDVDQKQKNNKKQPIPAKNK